MMVHGKVLFWVAFIMSLFAALNLAVMTGLVNIDISGLMNIINQIPLAKQGFAWLIPTILGYVIGAVVYKFKKKESIAYLVKIALIKPQKKNIGFVTQPIFLYAEIESYLQNLGEDIMKECYSIKSLLEQKVNLCFSTDAPATSWAVPSDPFVCIKGAVTRKSL